PENKILLDPRKTLQYLITARTKTLVNEIISDRSTQSAPNVRKGFGINHEYYSVKYFEKIESIYNEYKNAVMQIVDQRAQYENAGQSSSSQDNQNGEHHQNNNENRQDNINMGNINDSQQYHEERENPHARSVYGNLQQILIKLQDLIGSLLPDVKTVLNCCLTFETKTVF
ncbi:hypothetical protein Bhyg_04234, partial [Pseudolycoriella hygida]